MAAPNPNVKNAKTVMAQLLRAQRSGQYVEWKPIFSRLHVSGFADPATGLVQRQEMSFFSGTQNGGANQQGFARQLTPADTLFRAGEAVVPGGVEYVIFSLGISPQPEMPQWIKEAIVYNSTLIQRRQATIYEYGLVELWTAGDIGIQSKAASTTEPNTTINQAVNGSSGYRVLADQALIALPAKQPVEFLLRTHRDFYATTDGQPLGVGNALINNTGELNPAWYFTFQREVCGIVLFCGWGYQFSLPG